MYYIIIFYKFYNNKKIELWREFIPISANFDWNILIKKFKELSTFDKDIVIQIDMQNLTFGNPY